MSGSRRGVTATTTLLSTIVSLHPIYLDFDMSESEFIKYQKGQTDNRSGENEIALHLGGQTRIYNGRLDLIDNGIDREPPILGEHTVEVLKEAGYKDDEIAQLKRDAVI